MFSGSESIAKAYSTRPLNGTDRHRPIYLFMSYMVPIAYMVSISFSSSVNHFVIYFSVVGRMYRGLPQVRRLWSCYYLLTKSISVMIWRGGSMGAKWDSLTWHKTTGAVSCRRRNHQSTLLSTDSKCEPEFGPFASLVPIEYPTQHLGSDKSDLFTRIRFIGREIHFWMSSKYILKQKLKLFGWKIRRIIILPQIIFADRCGWRRKNSTLNDPSLLLLLALNIPHCSCSMFHIPHQT